MKRISFVTLVVSWFHLFALKSLILDAETPDFLVLSEQYRRFGADLRPERWMHGLGTTGGYDPYGELEALTGAPLDREALHREHRERYLALCEQQPLQPGVRGLITAAHARGIRLAVASSASREWVEGWLEQHALRPVFACVRTRSDGLCVKPAPDLFLSAAACLDAAPESCVVLEDSPNGMRAAAAAGMRCCAGGAPRHAPSPASRVASPFTGRPSGRNPSRSAGG